jgi:hypothetical protein
MRGEVINGISQDVVAGHLCGTAYYCDQGSDWLGVFIDEIGLAKSEKSGFA